MTLTESDALQIQKLQENSLLEEADMHILDVEQRGAVLVTCACCPPVHDIFRGVGGLHGPSLGESRFWKLSLNGGPLLIPNESQMNRALHEDRTLIEHLRSASRIDDIGVVALLAHVPCAVNPYPLLRTLDLLIRAKARLKWELVGMKAACFLHVDRANEGSRTYFLSQDKWERARSCDARSA